MAVEIPVIIDIDKAFEDAAKRVGNAMKPMQDYVDKNALGIRLKIDQNSTKTLSSILKDSSLSANQLNNALVDVERKIQRIASSKHGFDMVSGLTDKEKALLETYSILQRKITGIGNTSTATQKLITINIERVKKELESLSAKLKNADKGSAKFKNLNDKIAQAKINLSNLNAELDRVRARDSFAGLDSSLTRSNSKLVTLIKNSARLIALHTAGRFIRNVREVTAEFEMQRVALGGIIQDTEQANLLFRQIKAAAIESPFEIKDLVSYTKQLSAYRIETENLFDVTKRLADVSAGLGVDMGRLILAYGQVRAASVLRGQELRQFTEAGIPLVDLLAKKFQELNGRVVSTAEVFDLISKRSVPFEMIAEIFEDMTDKGGIFYKMQEKQAETLLGQWSNLKDAVSIMYDEIGNTSVVHRAMERMISDARNLMSNWRRVGTVVASLITQFALFKVASLFVKRLSVDAALAEKATLALARANTLEAASAGKANLVRKVSIASLKQYSMLMSKAASAQTVFGRSLAKMAANFVGGGWITAAITGLTVLVSWFISARQEANRLNKEIEKIETDGSLSLNRSISNFKRLADAAVSAADGSNEQNKALEELQRTYQDIIPSQNLQIDKLKEMKGDYDSLTSAISEKINMQLREQKINATTDFFTKKITKTRKDAKNLLTLYGLDKEQINAVMDEIESQVENGMINVNSTLFERSEVFQNIIKNLTGIVVDFGNGFRDYQGEWHQVSDINDKALKSLNSLANVYVELDGRVDEINNDMESSVGSMGVYAKAWEALKKDIDDVSISEKEFGDKYSFAFKKEKIKREVEIMADAIEKAFEGTNIDISKAFDPKGTINFSFLDEAASGSTKWGLRAYIKRIQESYESIVPTDPMVSVIERKFKEIASSVGLSMDDVQGYLLRGGKEMQEYAKEVSSSLEEAKYNVITLEKRLQDFKKNPNEAVPVSDKEMTKAKSLVVFLESINNYLVDYSKKASAKAKKSSLTFLKEDLKNVQEIYKRYQEFVAYLGESGARDKIKEIYGGVTAIDFLSPETYKKRLSDILREIRKLQGNVRQYNRELSEDMFNDIKETIRKNEGFAAEAYKNPGEKYFTIGYGFYKNLPDGREVTEGMKITVDEAEKYLDEYVRSYSSTVDNLLRQYGEGISLTERQFNVLVDLAYQGPAALKKALINSKGDINELAEQLKDAASTLVSPQLKDVVKKRDMRRYSAFMAGMSSEEDSEAIAEAILNAERVVQDVDWDEMKKDLERALKRLSDEIKRSETARNFYKNILDLTGDEELAATLGVSVYGDIGKDFKDRIQRQLEAAFYDLDFSALDDQTFSDLSMAVSTQDFATVLEYIHVFPEEWQKVLREMAADSQKYNADQISNLLKELQSAKSYGEKRVQLARETAQRIAEINQISGITSEEREALLARNAKKEAQEVAKLQYEAFKESPMYVELFANLDNASTQMLRNMRDEILRLNESWKDLDPVQLKEMQSRIKELDEQLARRNPIKALTDAFKEYKSIRETYGDRSDVDKKAMDALEEQVNKEKELEEAIKRVAVAEEHYRAVVANKGADSEEAKQAEGLVKSAKATMRARQSAAEAAREAADAAAAEQKKYADIIGDISEGVQGLSEWQDRIDKIADATRDLMETFGANDVDVQFFDDMVQGFSDVLGGATSAATGVAQLMAGDVVGGSMNLISGVAKAAKGISNLIYAPKVHAANKEIEHQAELLSDLEYSYERVSKAMDKAFGNDRIYLMNQKIEQQEAKIAAYQAQLDAENSKGKKKSQDAIEGYENSIRNAKDELQDLKDSVSEYWAGQDLASAAEAFADSWLKAYQEFGSTSDAIKEKMQDMVEGLVKRAALAGVVQAVLKPWYDELGKIETWDAGTVSDMINKAFSMVPMINDGLSVAAGELTAAGVSLRSQVGGFTGISRNIASASEESILALTAGINTQNFYMSYTPLIYDQVAAIAAAMTGGVDPKLSTAGAETPDMTQQYLSVLPSIDQNVADIKSMLKSVVSPNNTKSATHYVAVK